MALAKKSLAEVFRVSGVSQDRVEIEVLHPEEFKKITRRSLTIGSYLKISDDEDHSVIAIVRSYKIKDPASADGQSATKSPIFVIDAQPVGFLTASGEFRRGGQHIAIPPTKVVMATPDDLNKVYASSSTAPLVLGRLARDQQIEVPLNGDVFFSKHIAVVGTTGCGKSCTVAKILQEGIAPNGDQTSKGVLNNSHIVIFDLHGEYSRAFPETSRVLSVSNLKLPYWLLNGDELEEIFIMSDEANSYNQVSLFRDAVLRNKRKHNPTVPRLSFDSPVYFDHTEVYNYIYNINAEMVGKGGDPRPVLEGRVRVDNREDCYFDKELKFEEPDRGTKDPIGNGPFRGEFDRFVFRLQTILKNPRLAFLLNPVKDEPGSPIFKTEDLGLIMEGLVGYGDDRRNVTIVDLSGIPFEVMSLVVSLMSRLIFDIGFHLKKQAVTSKGSEIPLLAVYEEAHIYAPNSKLARYRSVTKSIERIAKEGRKYGICLMIVSQRPSEISETIFSQCNNIVAMRLSNPTDQHYVQRMLPDAVTGLTDSLPVLEQREALFIGDALTIPAIVRLGDLVDKPRSDDIEVLSEWREDWRTLPFAAVLEGMKER